ncbi:MFS transporter [Azospirillum sp. RWY-5-1]|uniref:MFS transporter n=1 Tax=Azospirillum oleiclasticum TaxID=2735135 RepID=A0ABX2T5U7_9PROT|nr:MFS transporter [Azospirillum oleiclasticum]NYZ12534.1 MFS transporter [Azospirillum oleiclasticum]NYZ19694.1 MFS transporter [Azospirillum oleiclasticum]
MQRTRVFLVFSLGFFISYIFRGVNLALAPDLIAALGLSASDLGLLTSLFFVAFAGSQIPLGMLLDRFGPRRVEAALLLVAAAGSVLSALATDPATLMAGRLLVGIGVSACLMGALKALLLWFPVDRLPVVNGGLFALGGLGAVAAAAPVEWALTVTDWRGVFLGMAAATVATAVLLMALVPERQGNQPDQGIRAQLAGLARILRDPFFWRLAPPTMVQQGTFLAVQGLWAGPYLMDVEGLDRQAAANTVSLVGLAMAAGFGLTGTAARALSLRGVPLAMTSAATMAGFLVMQVVILSGLPLPLWLSWALYGFFGASGVISYATVTAQFPPHLSGRANTAMTLTMFGWAFLTQLGIGAVLDAGTAAGYAAADLHRGVWAVLAAILAATLLPLFAVARRA